MQTVTMEEAQAQLPELIDAAAHGEPFLIESSDRRVLSVTVVEMEPDQKPLRRIGFMEGQFAVPEDFDTMYSQEILQMFGIED